MTFDNLNILIKYTTAAMTAFPPLSRTLQALGALQVGMCAVNFADVVLVPEPCVSRSCQHFRMDSKA